jgi:hypothetical protein
MKNGNFIINRNVIGSRCRGAIYRAQDNDRAQDIVTNDVNEMNVVANDNVGAMLK